MNIINIKLLINKFTINHDIQLIYIFNNNKNNDNNY